MRRFDRYMLSQLVVLFGFFALVLVAVYWVNRAVKLFDQLVADGHSARIFLEFTALSLPGVIVIVLPMACFASTVYVMNRLSAESELTVVQATGYSPWRLARPVFAFGLIVALMMGSLTHFLVPKSKAQLQQREREISASVTARVLREGMFLHPSSDVTLFIREITDSGELRDVILMDGRAEGKEYTYTSLTGFITVDADGPKMTLNDGLSQTLTIEDNTLATTYFDRLTYDISELVSPKGSDKRKITHVPTLELLTQPSQVAAELETDLGKVLEEAHLRFQLPLLCLVAALVGYAALISGQFSRFGMTQQIIGAIFLLVLIKLVESSVKTPVRADANLWPLVYLPSLFGLTAVWVMLRKASAPYRRPRGQKEQALA